MWASCLLEHLPHWVGVHWLYSCFGPTANVKINIGILGQSQILPSSNKLPEFRNKSAIVPKILIMTSVYLKTLHSEVWHYSSLTISRTILDGYSFSAEVSVIPEYSGGLRLFPLWFFLSYSYFFVMSWQEMVYHEYCCTWFLRFFSSRYPEIDILLLIPTLKCEEFANRKDSWSKWNSKTKH